MKEYETSFWNKRYSEGGNSGAGSYGPTLEKKLGWLSKLEVNSISEIGCGDFNFGWRLLKLFPKASYFGTDISDIIINRLTDTYPQYTFKLGDEIPPADLVLCVDVLLHVIDDAEVEPLLQKLEKAWTKYLVIT